MGVAERGAVNQRLGAAKQKPQKTRRSDRLMLPASRFLILPQNVTTQSVSVGGAPLSAHRERNRDEWKEWAAMTYLAAAPQSSRAAAGSPSGPTISSRNWLFVERDHPPGQPMAGRLSRKKEAN